MYSAKQLISRNVVTGFPEQRLAYLAEKIQALSAQYCAVLRPKTYVLVGLVRFSEVAANPSTATRIFSDLMRPVPPYQVFDLDPVEKVLELLADDPPEVIVLRRTGEFVGLITPDSFVRWLLSVTASDKFDLQKIPKTSRWHTLHAIAAGSAPPYGRSNPPHAS
ncbi:MAG: hypothetical protein JWM88_32 [Verrucomicrobia bacterium]|nr:hypothetical protein [Verrucomicrobiota bacterium]